MLFLLLCCKFDVAILKKILLSSTPVSWSDIFVTIRLLSHKPSIISGGKKSIFNNSTRTSPSSQQYFIVPRKCWLVVNGRFVAVGGYSTTHLERAEGLHRKELTFQNYLFSAFVLLLCYFVCLLSVFFAIKIIASLNCAPKWDLIKIRIAIKI